MACAPTGSGKTLAYIIPILTALKKHEKKGGFRALVLVPTRELCHQLERDFTNICSTLFKICILSKATSTGLKSSPSSSFGKDSFTILGPPWLSTLATLVFVF